MEAEDDYGNEQQAYWDWGHEKLQGEDDGGVVCAVSSMVACKTKEKNGFPSPSPTGPLQKGKQAPPSLSSRVWYQRPSFGEFPLLSAPLAPRRCWEDKLGYPCDSFQHLLSTL